MELKLKSNVNTSSVQSKIENILGDDFVVQNRYQQQADVFRIMEIEKLISYLFLTFILMIACFNVIGSLSMLILDKKDDVLTLRSLGASDKLISRKRGLTAAGTVPDLHRIPFSSFWKVRQFQIRTLRVQRYYNYISRLTSPLSFLSRTKD